MANVKTVCEQECTEPRSARLRGKALWLELMSLTTTWSAIAATYAVTHVNHSLDYAWIAIMIALFGAQVAVIWLKSYDGR